MTRCKVKCTSIEQIENWNKGPGSGPFLWNAKFGPADRTSPENAAFFEASPNLSMQIATVKANHFEVGREYYLDFSLAASPA